MLAVDMGWEVDVEVHVDSSAAKAVAPRRGDGRVWLLEVRGVWVQELVKKVGTKSNLEDPLTTIVQLEATRELVQKSGLCFGYPPGGRSASGSRY